MRPERYVWFATVCFATIYFMLGWNRYAIYRSGADLGLFTQSIATVFHGFANTLEAGSHFTFHFSPVLYLCAWPLLASHTPLALVALQSLAGALVAPPLFYFSRKRVPERIALGIALIGLLYPPLAGVVFTDFHENGFAPAATLWLIWAVDARRWLFAGMLLAFTLGIKEDQAVILTFVSLVVCLWFARRGDRAAATFAAFSGLAAIVTFVLFFELVRPLAGAHDAWAPTHFYTWNRIVDPHGSAPWYSIGRPAYFLEALVPLAFVPLLSPAFVLTLPGFAEVLGSHESLTYTMGTHYAAVWIPYLFLAFALATASHYAQSPKRARTLLRLAGSLCVLVLAFASPTHWKHYLGWPDRHIAVLDRFVAAVPAGARVGTVDEIYSHLGFDPGAQIGLAGLPEYALFDDRYDGAAWRLHYRPELRDDVRTGRYFALRTEDGITLYGRHPSSGDRRSGI